MTVRDSVPKPGIPMSPGFEKWWEAAAGGTLLLQHCAACGHRQHYPRPMCAKCWSESVSWIESAGTGTVWTLTVAHVPGHPAWLSEAPYVIAIVELDEGPRLLTNVVGADPSEVFVGQRVRMADASARTDQRLIQFVPAD